MWAKWCMNRIMHMYIQVICIWSTFSVQYLPYNFSYAYLTISEASKLRLSSFRKSIGRRSCEPNWLLTTAVCSTYLCPKIWRWNPLMVWKVFPGKNPPKGMGSFKRWKGENGWNKIELQWSTEEFAIFLLHSIHMFEVRAQQHWWATVLFFFQMWFSCQVGVQIHIYTLITSLVDWDRCDFCPQKHRLASRLKPVSYYVWQIPHDQHCRIVNYLHHCLLQT